jgi:hypothetical protein
MTFDGANKRIVLTTASVSASEIWTAYMNWLALDVTNAKWGLAMTQVGGDELGGGLFIPIYVFLKTGWKVRPMEASHSLTITGNLFTEDGSNPLVPPLGSFTVLTTLTVPVQAQAMAGGGSLSASDVWSHASRTLTTSGALTEAEHNAIMGAARRSDVFAAVSTVRR